MAVQSTGRGDLAAVSLYTGAGGLDYGFEAAGVRTRVAVDVDSDCCATLRGSRGWEVMEADISTVESDEILETAGLRHGEVDVLLGGPPCEPFFKSGYWVTRDSARLKDPRARTLYEYMRCVEDLCPRVFLLENVHGINYSGKGEGFELLRRLTQEVNKKKGTRYRLSWRVLNAADYGVPQQRRRFFLVGHREGEAFRFPEPTHVAEAGKLRHQRRLDGEERAAHTTAWDAIGEFSLRSKADELKVRGQWADLLPSIPEGENYLWHTARKGGLPLFGWRTRFWSFLLKLAKDRPSWTIQAQPGPAIGPFHWENRMLSVQEMARLQTFPADVSFVGTRNSVQRQIGNAVPSLLGEVLGRAITSQFFGVEGGAGLQLSVPVKRPIPRPKRRHPVPRKYRHLVRDHPPHPGEGKGRRAKRRLSSVQLEMGQAAAG